MNVFAVEVFGQDYDCVCSGTIAVFANEEDANTLHADILENWDEFINSNFEPTNRWGLQLSHLVTMSILQRDDISVVPYEVLSEPINLTSNG